MNDTRLHVDPITRVRKEMEIITADGRCAGYVSGCTAEPDFYEQIPSDHPQGMDPAG